MVFAGARFSLFTNGGTGGAVTELKGDKKGIGYRGIAQDVTFTNHDVEIDQEAIYYMTSDGIIDQIGGEKKRSFGKKRLKALIADLYQTPLPAQGERFLRAIEQYQGREERRDDISMVGFKIVN